MNVTDLRSLVAQRMGDGWADVDTTTATAIGSAVITAHEQCAMHPRLVRVGDAEHHKMYVREDIVRVALANLREFTAAESRALETPAPAPAPEAPAPEVPAVDPVAAERARIVAVIRTRADLSAKHGSATRASLLRVLASDLEHGIDA